MDILERLDVWLWDCGPSWIHLPHGAVILLGSLLGTIVGIELVQWLRKRESVFF